MKKRFFAIFIPFLLIFCLCSCTRVERGSSFSITFIDVGQGDAALVECDGHYMLIDGGDTLAGDKVYNTLVEKGVQKLDILAMSHLHADHIGGLEKALTYASSIGITISNAASGEKETFRKVEHQLEINESQITVPHVGEKFELGSSIVEVIDLSADEANDSLVLLVTYGKTKFLFSGDIEETAQKRIINKFQNKKDEPYKVDLIKLPHHGSYTGTLYGFLRTFMADNIVISVGKDNPYGHPHRETMDMLDSKTYKPNVYRTDINGDIIVKSDGNTLYIDPEKE